MTGNGNKEKAFIDLPEFVCLSYPEAISEDTDKAKFLTSVLCANGYSQEQIFEYAEKRGILDRTSEKYIEEKADLRQYYFPGGDCREAAKECGINHEQLWAMCTNCARSQIGYNVFSLFERNLIGSTYRKICNNEKPEKVSCVKMLSMLAVLYDDQGVLKSYVNKEYGSKVYSYLCSTKNRFSGDLKKDSADIATAILRRDKKGYGDLSEREKHSISEQAFCCTERMLGKECTEEELIESVSALSTDRKTGIFSQTAFRNAYKNGALYSKEGYGKAKWPGITHDAALENGNQQSNGLTLLPPLDVEDHKKFIRGELDNKKNGKPDNAKAENATTSKDDIGYQYTLSDYGTEFPKMKLKEPEKGEETITFDDNLGILLSVPDSISICRPETSAEAGRYLEEIHDSITVGIEAAVLNEKEGLLFCSSYDRKPVFICRKILTEEILQSVFDGRKYTLFSINSVPVRRYAWDYGIREAKKLISLSAMYHVCCDDDLIYPAGYFMKCLGHEEDISVKSFLTVLFPNYAEIDIRLFSEIVADGKEKESSRLNLFEEVLASSFAIRQISKLNCCPLWRTGYTKNRYELPAVIEMTKGGCIIRCFNVSENGAVMDFDFMTVLFVKLLRRPPFSGMNIRWSVLKISEREICLWTHLKNTAGVEMVKEALAIAIADTSKKLKREPFEIYFETD